MRCPDRASLERIDRFCRDNGIGLRIDRLWEAADRGDGASTTLTDPQREAVLRAAESGYLDVPRSRSLAELGADLSVSGSAASERFRRGVKALIKDVLE